MSFLWLNENKMSIFGVCYEYVFAPLLFIGVISEDQYSMELSLFRKIASINNILSNEIL